MKNLSAVRKTVNIAVFSSLATVAAASHALAADITFLCANALEPAMKELIPEFQKTSGHNVSIIYATLGVITERVRKGDQADLASVSPPQWESLQKEGKVDPGIRMVVGRSGLGVFTKKGAPLPDIGSVEAFKRTLLNAHSIAVGDPGKGSPVGAYMLPLFDRLGLTDDIKSKLRLTAGGPATMQPVARGDIELGINQMTEIVTSPDVDLIGPLPVGVQNITIYTAAAPVSAKQPAAAKALLEFLISPRAASVFRSKGFEPG